MKRSTTYNCKHCGKETKVTYSKQNVYCSNACQLEYQTQARISDWLDKNIDWHLQVPSWAKRYLVEQRGNSCEICNVSEWNGRQLVLECDHIDGNHKNNRPENLRLICPNCHSQTDTYKARNKGNGRKYRRSLP